MTAWPRSPNGGPAMCEMVRTRSSGQRTPAYNSWRAARYRTSQATHDSFSIYGGRGIRMCARWRNSFKCFAADMGPRAPDERLDRIDPNDWYRCGHPECADCGPAGLPPNCRWLPASLSSARRRGVWMVRLPVGEISLSRLSRQFGLGRATTRWRALKGQSLEEVLRPTRRTMKEGHRCAATWVRESEAVLFKA